MTVDTPAADAVKAAAGPSIHVIRARKLLLGGAVGGVSAAVLCLIGFGLGYGGAGLLSAAAAAVLVLGFYAVGQYVMVLFADVGARLLLSVALFSYTTRVLLLGLALLAYESNVAALPALVPTAVFLTTVAVVVGWLITEVWVFRRLRITAYDTPYEPPPAMGAAG